jgi:hypothetical protein
MTRYFEGRIDGVINDRVYLRDDLYDRFMERAMVFYPRPVQQQVETEGNAGPGPDTGDSTLTSPPRPSTIQLAVHVLRPGYSGQLAAQYHKRFIQPIRGPAVELIFALLACAIFDVPVSNVGACLPGATVRVFPSLRKTANQETEKPA